MNFSTMPFASAHEIERAIKQLRHSAAGPDRIHYAALEAVAIVSAKLLPHCMYIVWDGGEMPDDSDCFLAEFILKEAKDHDM